MDVNIFLASSSELKEDRNNFQIFINQLNEDWRHREIYFRLTLWENFIDSMSVDGLQERYNNAVTNCDIFLMLFFTKVGAYTAAEFERAFKEFSNKNSPRIYTYFKDDFILTGHINDDIISLLGFKKKLAELKHYYTTYTSIEDLKWKFSKQIEKVYGNQFSVDFDISSVTSQSQIDSMAIENVCKLLSPNYDIKNIDGLKLPALISRTSPFGRNAVFQLAKVNRRSNREDNRKLMQRSIPIFEALIDANLRRDDHRYFGQLAYALKDQEKSNWLDAEQNFSAAIDVRTDAEPEYFYEFNRAICCINNGKNPPEIIMQDLSYAKRGIGKQFDDLLKRIENRIIVRWLTDNKLQLKEI